MGQIVKQVSAHTTRYYWYPGDKTNWIRGAVAIALGGAAFALLRLATHDPLLAAVVGTSVTAALAGLNFGRRDSRELARFGEIAAKAPRRQAIVHTGRAAWRGIAEGTGGAAAAVIIVNLSARGVFADWLLPLVPAVVGALAHQAGMMYERLGRSQATAGPAKPAAPTSSAARQAATPSGAKPATVASPAAVVASAAAQTAYTAPPAPVSVALPAAHSGAAPVAIPVALLTPVKTVRPPMPARVALLELAEAQRAEAAQAHRDRVMVRPVTTTPLSATVDEPPVNHGRPRNDGPRKHRAGGRHVGRASVPAIG